MGNMKIGVVCGTVRENWVGQEEGLSLIIRRISGKPVLDLLILTSRLKGGKISLMNLNFRLIKQVKSSRWLLVWAVLAGFGAGIAAVIQASQLSSLLAKVHLEGAGLAEVMPFLWFFGFALLIRASLFFISEVTASSGAARIKENLRVTIVAHIFSSGPAAAQDGPSGQLLSTVSQGIDALDAYFSQYLPQLALAAMLPLAYLFIVIPSDPISGLVLLVTGPLIPLFMFLIGRNAQALTHRQWAALERMNAYFLDTLQGLSTLKALGRSRDQADRIARVSDQFRDTTLSVLRVTFLSALALELLSTMGTAIVAVEVGLRLLYGRMNFEEAFFILLLTPDFYLPLRALGLRFHASMSGVSAAQKIFEVLDRPALDGSTERKPVRHPTPDPSPQTPLERWEILLNGVSFTYPGRSQPALDDVNISIPPGKMTALVGPSGAGKSTIVQMVLGFLRPERGYITMNGLPFSELAMEEWRSQVAWVPQQPYLFQGSIASNLLFARPGAPQEELERAAGLAGLSDFIASQPKGFDTPVGEGGARLSTGQVQRLALARAFLRDAPFLVIDEPTAHLDVEQEQFLKEAIRQLSTGRTVLLIAHRLPTVMESDQVYFLDSGRVLEYGAPAGLIAQNSAFARLVLSYDGRKGSL
jgi:thiol reductant ABC exporter CydD subunit